MDIKPYRLIGVIGIFVSTMFSTCKCRTNCTELQYTFDIGCVAYPDMDSIKIGDTIWLEINVPVNLKDERSGINVNYSRAVNLGTAIDILKIKPGTVSIPGSVPSAKSFDYYLVKGTFEPKTVNGDRIKEFLFIENNRYYQFKVGFIPKEKGAFIIAPGNAANVYRKNNKCTKAGFLISFEDTDQHLYLYERSRPGYTPSEYERTHMYCFKVY